MSPKPGSGTFFSTLAVRDLRLAQGLLEAEDRAARHVRGVERLHPVPPWASRASFASSSGVSALRFFLRVSRSCEARVGLELRQLQHVADRLPLLLLVGGDVDVAVLGPEGAARARR